MLPNRMVTLFGVASVYSILIFRTGYMYDIHFLFFSLFFLCFFWTTEMCKCLFMRGGDFYLWVLCVRNGVAFQEGILMMHMRTSYFKNVT